MSQSKVTDFFNASRKNVRRSCKNVEGFEPVKQRKVQTNTQTATAKGTKRSKTKVDSQSRDQDQSYSPAFKRFRYLIPPIEDTPSSSADALFPSTKTTKLSATVSQTENNILSQSLSFNETTSASVPALVDSKSSRVPVSLFDDNISSKNALTVSAEKTDVATISNINVERSVSSSSKVSPKKTPAFQRFAHLVPSVSEAKRIPEPALPELSLPYTYKILRDTFKAMDNIASMLISRKELMSFSKLQEAVQKVVRRDFKEETIGQIRSLYKGSYSVRYEKNVPKFGRKASSKYELIIDVNLKDDETLMSTCEESKLVFNGTRLVQRRETFLSKITNFLLGKHQEFLCKELKISPSDMPPHHSIKRWHPSFPLDKIESPVPEPMPPRPDANEKHIVTAQEAVAIFKEKGMLREASACQRAANELNGGKEIEPNDSITLDPSASRKQGGQKKDKLRGVSSSLIERIRAKEAAKASYLMSRGGPEWEKKHTMLSRLPDLAIHTWNLFATTRKPVLTVSYLCEKIGDSHPSGLSSSSIHEHLRLLSESLPGWLELLDWSKPHARICDMKRNLADVRASLQKLVDDRGT